MADNQAIGAAGERLVEQWYSERGYEIVARNWRVRAGELDLVVTRAGVLVFCEVKTRSGLGYGSPKEAVTPAKQRRIRSLALEFLRGNRLSRAAELRFDVASVLPGSVEVVTGAF